MALQKLPIVGLDDENQKRRLVEVVNAILTGAGAIQITAMRVASWTAVVQGSGTAGTYEIGTQHCRYMRIGPRVFLDVWIELAGAITGGGTGSLIITGLPFAKIADTYPIGNVLLDGVNWTGGASLSLGFGSTGASSALVIEETNDNAANSAVQISGVAATDRIFGSVCYETDDL